jgi:hypothetical protein
MKSGDFNAAAKGAGLEVKTTEFIARGGQIADSGPEPLGRCRRVQNAAE